jgi:hypothetical protein
VLECASHDVVAPWPTTSEDAAVSDADRERSLRLFWAKVNKTQTCWLWTGARNQAGYGKLRRGGRVGKIILAHRFAYEALIGPIPCGLVIDHICRVLRCVNPAHMEPVTDRENVRRGVGPTATNARKTYCKYGHGFTEANTGETAGGNRYCLRCAYLQSRSWRLEHADENRAYQREWARRKREALSNATRTPRPSGAGGEG